jgi:hypothetical protein
MPPTARHTKAGWPTAPEQWVSAAVLIGRHHVDVRREPVGYRGEDTPVGERAKPNLYFRACQTYPD